MPSKTECSATCDAPPEPVIGPGMILERGRERYIIGRECYRTDGERERGTPIHYHTFWQKKSVFGNWCTPRRKSNYSADYEIMDACFRAMLLSGFRVIRPADTQRNPDHA